MPDFGSKSDGGWGSLWLRPLRILLEQGKPIGSLKVLLLPVGNGRAYPFGVLQHTLRERIVFWPVLPREHTTCWEDEEVHPVDHVTLELPKGRTHVTWFDSGQRRCHHSRGWRIHRFQGTGIAFWFHLVFRWELVEEGETGWERTVKWPTTDANRREREFAQLADHFELARVAMPAPEPVGDYVFVGFYVVVGSTPNPCLDPKMFLAGAKVDKLIEGWPDETAFPIQPMRIRVGDTRLLIATAVPPGRLKGNVVLGFPHGRQQGQTGER